MSNPTLVALVAEAYGNAMENDYDLSTWTDEEIAGDMAAYDADIENYEYEDILEAVIEFRASL